MILQVIKRIFNPIALRKAKIVYNFGLSECSRVKEKRLYMLTVSYLEIKIDGI